MSTTSDSYILSLYKLLHDDLFALGKERYDSPNSNPNLNSNPNHSLLCVVSSQMSYGNDLPGKICPLNVIGVINHFLVGLKLTHKSELMPITMNWSKVSAVCITRPTG